MAANINYTHEELQAMKRGAVNRYGWGGIPDPLPSKPDPLPSKAEDSTFKYNQIFTPDPSSSEWQYPGQKLPAQAVSPTLTSSPLTSTLGSNPLFSGLSSFRDTKPTTRPTTPTPSRTLSTADRPSMDSYSSYKPAISSTSSAAPIPYGSRTSWEPGAGTTMPTVGAMPEYMMPEIDRGRISELQELSMGAPMGKLRRGLSETALGTRSIENPNVRAQMLRNLMSGYGEGISDIRAGAGREAMSMYMPEFQAAGQKAQAEYQTGVSGVMAQFQADLGDYMKRGSQVTTPVQGRYEGSTRAPITWG